MGAADDHDLQETVLRVFQVLLAEDIRLDFIENTRPYKRRRIKRVVLIAVKRVAGIEGDIGTGALVPAIHLTFRIIDLDVSGVFQLPPEPDFAARSMEGGTDIPHKHVFKFDARAALRLPGGGGNGAVRARRLLRLLRRLPAVVVRLLRGQSLIPGRAAAPAPEMQLFPAGKAFVLQDLPGVPGVAQGGQGLGLCLSAGADVGHRAFLRAGRLGAAPLLPIVGVSVLGQGRRRQQRRGKDQRQQQTQQSSRGFHGQILLPKQAFLSPPRALPRAGFFSFYQQSRRRASPAAPFPAPFGTRKGGKPKTVP